MPRIPEVIKHSEYARLAFVAGRDGIDEMLFFARQTYRLYRAALRGKDGKPSPYGKAYRIELLCSCIVFRKVLREHGASNHC